MNIHPQLDTMQKNGKNDQLTAAKHETVKQVNLTKLKFLFSYIEGIYLENFTGRFNTIQTFFFAGRAKPRVIS